jgi:hypothetical protein
MRNPIPLSSCILAFELASLIGIPLALFGMRRIPPLRIVAKVWSGVLVLGILLQVLAVGYKRTCTFPMRWSLNVPPEIQGEIHPVTHSIWPEAPNQATVVLSREPLAEKASAGHVCYQVIFSDALARRLQAMGHEVVEVEYDVTFRFDTPIFIGPPRLKGDDPKILIGDIGYMSFGRGTSGYTCFPGPGVFE